MKVFVTGATGFIGKYLIAQLLEKGVEVNGLVRDLEKAKYLEEQGVKLYQGDITDIESMRDGMTGCDVVYHMAGYYKLGANDAKEKADRINIDGTRNVCSLALELKIPKFVYVSTLATYGDTKGKAVLEEQQPATAPTTSHYDRTKWQAHKIVKGFIAKGLPAVITMPGIVFGIGDHSVYGEALDFFLKGWLFVVPGYETGLTYVHVKDVAAALILAAEKGKPGEYITSGPCFTVGELFDLWAEVSGRRAPKIRIPAAFIRPSWPVMQLIGYLIPLPQLLSGEVTRIIGVTYYGDSSKVKRELGWEPQPVRQRLIETLIEMGEIKA